MGTFEIGQVVLAQRNSKSEPFRAVVVALAETGTPAVARLTKDGAVRAETLWTGLYKSVTPAP